MRQATFHLTVLLMLALSASFAGCTLVNGTDDWAAERSLEEDARPQCVEYCDTITSLCVNEFSQYSDRDECFEACANMTIGLPGDYAIDTIECRLTHLLAAPADPGTHCEHAGPDGGGQCIGNEPSDCSAYCANFIERCPAEANTDDSPVFNCAHECSLFEAGFDDDYYFNTLECRENWLELASDPQNDAVCAFVKPDDALGCNDDDESRPDCQALCRLSAMNCGADEMACMSECTTTTQLDQDSIFCATQAAAADPPRCDEAADMRGCVLQ